MRERMASTTDDDSAGFTLIELVVVVAILPLVVGGIAVALISVFSLQTSVSNRVSDSNDALVASTVFNRDVQSSQMVTTDANPADPAVPACGAATQHQVLGLEWGFNAGNTALGPNGGYQTVVSYVSQLVPDSQSRVPVYALVRQVCSSGPATTGFTTQQLSGDIGTLTPQVTFSPASALASSATAWITTVGLTAINLHVTEPGADFASAGGSSQDASDNYSFSLVGLPGAATSSGTALDPNSNPTGQCSFASPGTGTYANQLCFVDFTNYPTAKVNPTYCTTTPTAVEMSIAITGTADTLKFCLSYSGTTTIAPNAIPTYYAAGSSEAFLGNNGFYTGVSGEPALYSAGGGYSYMYFTNVQLFDSSGNPASGWTLVTGDAESTDPSEWMSFASNLSWSVLPNNGASDLWGNACYTSLNPTHNNSGAFNWTSATPPSSSNVPDPGSTLPSTSNATTLSVNTNNNYSTGTSTILCESNTSLNHTGTMMLQAQEPSGSTAAQTLTVSMKGTGREAMFLAVLL
jgi:prepilin-type N-terminal cleavage/methylation domain-containing protein